MWNQVKVWLYAIGTAVFAALGVASVHYKKKANKAEAQRDTLKATVNAERVRKKIEKQQKRVLEENEEKIKKDIKDATKPVDLDHLFNDDNW